MPSQEEIEHLINTTNDYVSSGRLEHLYSVNSGMNITPDIAKYYFFDQILNGPHDTDYKDLEIQGITYTAYSGDREDLIGNSGSTLYNPHGNTALHKYYAEYSIDGEQFVPPITAHSAPAFIGGGPGRNMKYLDTLSPCWVQKDGMYVLKPVPYIKKLTIDGLEKIEIFREIPVGGSGISMSEGPDDDTTSRFVGSGNTETSSFKVYELDLTIFNGTYDLEPFDWPGYTKKIYNGNIYNGYWFGYNSYYGYDSYLYSYGYYGHTYGNRIDYNPVYYSGFFIDDRAEWEKENTHYISYSDLRDDVDYSDNQGSIGSTSGQPNTWYNWYWHNGLLDNGDALFSHWFASYYGGYWGGYYGYWYGGTISQPQPVKDGYVVLSYGIRTVNTTSPAFGLTLRYYRKYDTIPSGQWGYAWNWYNPIYWDYVNKPFPGDPYYLYSVCHFATGIGPFLDDKEPFYLTEDSGSYIPSYDDIANINIQGVNTLAFTNYGSQFYWQNPYWGYGYWRYALSSGEWSEVLESLGKASANTEFGEPIFLDTESQFVHTESGNTTFRYYEAISPSGNPTLSPNNVWNTGQREIDPVGYITTETEFNAIFNDFRNNTPNPIDAKLKTRYSHIIKVN